MAIPSILAPGQIPKTVIHYDICAMAALTGILWMAAIQGKKDKVLIGRWDGTIIFIGFVIYILVSLQ